MRTWSVWVVDGCRLSGTLAVDLLSHHLTIQHVLGLDHLDATDDLDIILIITRATIFYNISTALLIHTDG
jgi:hypothetical protein